MRRLMILATKEEAFFHGWQMMLWPEAEGKQPTAVVEKSNGLVCPVPFWDIQFISPPDQVVGDPFEGKIIGQILQREHEAEARQKAYASAQAPPRFKYMTRAKLQENTRLGNAISDWLLHLGLPYTLASAFDVMIEVERLSEGSEAEALDILRLNLERKNKKLYWDHEFRSNVPDLFVFDWSDEANSKAVEELATKPLFPVSHELEINTEAPEIKQWIDAEPEKQAPVQTPAPEKLKAMTEPVKPVPAKSFDPNKISKALKGAIARWITYVKRQSRYNGKFSAWDEKQLLHDLYRMSGGDMAEAVNIINYSIQTDAGVLVAQQY